MPSWTPPVSPTAERPPVEVQIDHFVLLVNYTDLIQPPAWITSNFTLAPGGKHTDGLTENKLIIFEDGTYIELIAFMPETESIRKGHRWDGKKPGFVDFALTTVCPLGPGEGARDSKARLDFTLKRFESLKRRIDNGTGGGRGGTGGAATAKALGIDYSPPTEGGRTRSDGTELKWITTFPKARNPAIKVAVTGEVPFWCHDITPRAKRVDLDPKYTTHPSGAKGVAQFTVMVPRNQLESYVQLYSSILDAQPVRVFGTYRLHLGTPSEMRELVKPCLFLEAPSGGLEQRRLEERGAGMVELALRTGAPETSSVGLAKESVVLEGILIHFLK